MQFNSIYKWVFSFSHHQPKYINWQMGIALMSTIRFCCRRCPGRWSVLTSRRWWWLVGFLRPIPVACWCHLFYDWESNFGRKMINSIHNEHVLPLNTERRMITTERTSPTDRYQLEPICLIALTTNWKLLLYNPYRQVNITAGKMAGNISLPKSMIWNVGRQPRPTNIVRWRQY